VDGRFKMDPNFKKIFPKTYLRITTLKQRLTGNKLSAFLLYGRATCGEVYSAMSKGKGPNIVLDSLGFDQNNNPYKGLFKPTMPTTLFIDVNYVLDFESGLVSGEDFDTTIEHELVHYFENKNYGNTSEFEEGYQYELYQK